MGSSKDGLATDGDKTPANRHLPESDSNFYSNGEKVLAYHDHLIYEAKVQKAEIRKNEWKYFIHYLGWSKNWDEWVAIDRLMKYSEENIVKQQALDRKQGVDKNSKSGRSTRARPKISSGAKWKKRKSDSEMEIIKSDDVLRNILSRLPPKPLMRFSCASEHWNSLITDPYFLNSCISRPMILLLSTRNIFTSDYKKTHLISVHPSQNLVLAGSLVVGTVNGIVLLALRPYLVEPHMFILYNPLTRATKKLPDPPYPCCGISKMNEYAYGFVYGVADDFKIIIAEGGCLCLNKPHCHVFDFKKGSWTSPKTTFQAQNFKGKVGVFLNGFVALDFFIDSWNQLYQDYES